MLKILDLYLNNGKIYCYCGSRSTVSDTLTPEFSWSVNSNVKSDRQTAFEVIVKNIDGEVLNTGWIGGGEQKYVCEKPLPENELLDVSVKVKNTKGEIAESDWYSIVCSTGKDWKGQWITHPHPLHERPVEFAKDFIPNGKIKSAVMFVCGVGYHYVTINGEKADNSLLDPATSNFEKTCYYSIIDIADMLYRKKNRISITVADGWRYNDTNMFRIVFANRPVEFFGNIALTSYIDITYEDGTKETFATDDSWKCRYDKITQVSIFKGETYDARVKEKFVKAVICENPPKGVLRPMTVEPIIIKRRYMPQNVFETQPGTYILDFGQNMAGIPHVCLPGGMKSGDRFTLRFGEMLDFDGNLFNEPLRDAPQTDTYIANGEEKGDYFNYWDTKFTYHGFRYCEVKGYPDFTGDEIWAYSIYTDIDKESDFSCGNALVTKLHRNCVMTERSNIHSILTDCPQRDERMAWMNDATVRFQETPYNFDIGHIFAKVAQDIRDEQRPDGAFTCCAPFLYGCYPADPVCSSYLMTGVSSLLHNGNVRIIRDFFDGYAAWEQSLLSRSDDYIVNYSYYGDWAAPCYACGSDENAMSQVTPGIFMSTGYSYFNCKTLADFAVIIGREDDAAKYAELAEKIRNAMLEKWFDRETGRMATGSQACQAFSLWLGIIPKDKRTIAAKVMRDDLVANNYRFTTGNLCTRYLLDMLAEYGYIDDAWELITKETYPSYGYMIQNEATTVWERFELKRTPGMNSHNHPMYAAADYWLYAYICGVKPEKPGFESFTVRPYYPEKLLSAECTVDTVKGKIHVRWVKKFGKRCLYVNVPFGTTADIYISDTCRVTVGSGSHTFISNM